MLLLPDMIFNKKRTLLIEMPAIPKTTLLKILKISIGTDSQTPITITRKHSATKKIITIMLLVMFCSKNRKIFLEFTNNAMMPVQKNIGGNTKYK